MAIVEVCLSLVLGDNFKIVVLGQQADTRESCSHSAEPAPPEEETHMGIMLS